MQQRSDRRKLAELTLSRAGTDLTSVVGRLRGEGLGWRGVSDRLDEHYGVDLHATTLMRWFAEDVQSTPRNAA